MESNLNSHLVDPISKDPYDLEKNLPMSLRCCGRTCSQRTIEAIKHKMVDVCPFIECGKTLSDDGFYVNQQIYDEIVKRENTLKETRNKKKKIPWCCYDHHDREGTIICLDHNVLLCVECLAEERKHIEHSCKDRNTWVEQTKKNLRNVEPGFANIERIIKERLHEMSEKMLNKIGAKCEEKVLEVRKALESIEKCGTSEDYELTFVANEVLKKGKIVSTDLITKKMDNLEQFLLNLGKNMLVEDGLGEKRILEAQDEDLNSESLNKEINELLVSIMCKEDENTDLKSKLKTLEAENLKIDELGLRIVQLEEEKYLLKDIIEERDTLKLAISMNEEEMKNLRTNPQMVPHLRMQIEKEKLEREKSEKIVIEMEETNRDLQERIILLEQRDSDIENFAHILATLREENEEFAVRETEKNRTIEELRFKITEHEEEKQKFKLIADERDNLNQMISMYEESNESLEDENTIITLLQDQLKDEVKEREKLEQMIADYLTVINTLKAKVNANDKN